MIGLARFGWAEAATEATVSLVAPGAATAEDLLSPLGSLEARGSMSFAEALDLQGSFYDDDTFDRRAVFQVAPLPGDGGDWWASVEPNGYRMSDASGLRAIALGRVAASFYWNVNAVMRVVRVDPDVAVAGFDPLLDHEDIPEECRDLPFANAPRSAAMAALERWTGVTITAAWFEGHKPTFIVQTA